MRTRILAGWLVVAGSVVGVGTAAPSARFDPSCTALLAARNKQAGRGQAYNIELTMHRESAKLVTYSSGFLSPNADGSFAGASNQLFSDRFAGGQPFSMNAADQLNLNLSPTGLLRIHYSPWNFDTSWDLSCRGSMLTAYLPGFGIVTLTFRDLFFPIG
jgi:hypothetical protein